MNNMKSTLITLLFLLATSCGKESGYVYEEEDESNYENYPEFSWDHIPLYQHLNNSADYFTSDEIETLAKSQLVCIELQQAIRLWNGKYCIENTAYEAERIKALNPKSKVLHYWHSSKDLGRYYQPEQFINSASDERVIYNASNKPVFEVSGDDVEYVFDMRKSETSKWWSNFVLMSCMEYPAIDGCFADGIGFYYAGCDATYGEGSSVELWRAFVGALQRIDKYRSDNMLIIVNGYEDTKPWNEDVLAYCDGAMIEHFCAMGDGDRREKIHSDIAKIQECGRQGKVAVVKGWPRFTFVDVQNPKSEYCDLYNNDKAKLYNICREDIDFSLACFLVAAGKYAYFSYGWGYDNDSGNLLDYPEFYNYRLGEPKGDAVRVGDIYTREFEYASVKVDLTGYQPNSKGYKPDGSRVASITWLDHK